MVTREKDIRLFERAAKQRLKAAWFLFDDDAKEFNLDAVYLAGYAVECILKAMILKHSAKSSHAETMQLLTEVGALAHDFEYLKAQLKARLGRRNQRDRHTFGRLTESLQNVARWSTDMRYQVEYLPTRQASLFLKAAQEIVDWSKRG